MKCPLCDVPMREVNRRGVQIDVCPECKGVWLDRGELEKLIEVSEQEELAYERGSARRDDDRPRYDEDGRRRGAPVQQKKKKGWLSQMMEAVGGEGADD